MCVVCIHMGARGWHLCLSQLFSTVCFADRASHWIWTVWLHWHRLLQSLGLVTAWQTFYKLCRLSCPASVASGFVNLAIAFLFQIRWSTRTKNQKQRLFAHFPRKFIIRSLPLYRYLAGPLSRRWDLGYEKSYTLEHMLLQKVSWDACGFWHSNGLISPGPDVPVASFFVP